MGNLGVTEIIVILFAMLTPVIGVVIGLLLARRSKRKREKQWNLEQNKNKVKDQPS